MYNSKLRLSNIDVQAENSIKYAFLKVDATRSRPS